MTHRRFLIILTVLTLIAALPVAAADFNGTWTASFDTQIGQQNYTYVFKVSGTQLTGTAKSDNGESALRSGKVDGDKITFIEDLHVMDMDIEVTYTGIATSNDEIKFTRDVGGFATEELVAKRMK